MKCERIKQKIDELIFENNEMFAKEDTTILLTAIHVDHI